MVQQRDSATLGVCRNQSTVIFILLRTIIFSSLKTKPRPEQLFHAEKAV